MDKKHQFGELLFHKAQQDVKIARELEALCRRLLLPKPDFGFQEIHQEKRICIRADYKEKLVFFNFCLLDPQSQEFFLGSYKLATDNGVDPVEFVEAWNRHAQEIHQHVFIKIPEVRL